MTTDTLSEQDAEKLFNDAYNSVSGKAPSEEVVVPPAVVEPTPEPEVEPKQEEPPAPIEEQPQTPDPVDAWLKDAPEEVRQRYVKELTDFNANRQRQAGLQRHLMEARQELERVRGQVKTAPPVTPVAEKPLEKWKALTETDSELALSVEERIQRAVEQVKLEVEQKLTHITAPLVTSQYDQYIEREVNLLKQVVPNYEEVVNHPQFIDWISHQSADVQNKYSTSVNHQDAIQIMKLYDYDLRINGYVPPQQSTPAESPNPQADAIAAQRAARVSSSAPTTRAAVKVPTRDPNAPMTEAEEKEIFEKAYNAASRRT